MASADIAGIIIAAAQQQGVEPSLALEVANAESGLNPNVSPSSKGAVGVMQLLPSSFPGVNVYDLQTNINTGVAYLRQMIAQFGDPAAALAAYNWGPSNVSSAMSAYGTNWLSAAPGETQRYVSGILGNVQTQYSASVGPAPATATPGSPIYQAGFVPVPSAGTDWSTIAIAFGLIVVLAFALNGGF